MLNAIVLTYRCIVQILLPVGRQNDGLYGVVVFPLKHESPPLLAGFFLSISSLAIYGVIFGEMAPVFALWIVGVRRFLSLQGLTGFLELLSTDICADGCGKQILRVAQDDSGGAGFSHPAFRVTAPLKPKEGLNRAPAFAT